MNTFGQIFRVSIFGASHGMKIGMQIDGCPAGLRLEESLFAKDLQRRQGGQSGTTARCEADVPEIISGLYQGKTTGTPLVLMFDNTDTNSTWYEENRNLPRPGHADFVAEKKYSGYQDVRGGGAFSGRMTVAMVAAGVVAKMLIEPVEIVASLIEVGGKRDIQKEISRTIKNNDSVGGLIECKVASLPVGLGEPYFDSLESLISHMMFSIGGIKAIEFGSGFALAKMYGSESNDSIIDKHGKTASNHAGGICGGISNGNELYFNVAVKPTPSIGLRQKTIDILTGKEAMLEVCGRHDACIALRVPPIVEAGVAMVLVDLMLREQMIARKI